MAHRPYSIYKENKQRYLNATLHYTLWQDAIAHAMTYDAATGVRTYSPRNVDGNWGAKLSTDDIDTEKEYQLIALPE